MSKYNFEQKRNDYMSPPELVKMALQNLDMTKNKLPFVLRWSIREYTTNQNLILKSKENDHPLW